MPFAASDGMLHLPSPYGMPRLAIVIERSLLLGGTEKGAIGP
jgi:hypothetical protein